MRLPFSDRPARSLVSRAAALGSAKNHAAAGGASSEARYVGKSVQRYEAMEKVNGQWIYGTDFTLPGMLYAKTLRSPYAHARILKVDVSRAKQLAGVHAVVTGEDAPYLFGSACRDEPFLARGKVRYAGESVAAVAAISEEIAREAVDLIDVEYEELTGIFDPLEAMQPGAPILHEDLGSYEIEPVFTCNPGTNIINHTKIRRGDIEQGFGESDEVYEDVFTTQYIQHAPLETHVGIAQISPSGKVTLWSNSQAPYNYVRDMARALDLPYSQVRVICTGIGGGFGYAHRWQACQTCLYAGRGIHVQRHQTPGSPYFQDRRQTRWHAGRAQDHFHLQHWRLCRYRPACFPQRLHQRHRTLSLRSRLGRQLLRLHQQPAGRRFSWLRRASAHVGT